MIRKYFETPTDLLRTRWPNMVADNHALEQVWTIVDKVRVEGDAALTGYTEEFDGVRVEPGELEVGTDEMEEAYSGVTEDQIAALNEAKRRLEAVESARLKGLDLTVELDGVNVRGTFKPLHRVGCYVPGGGAAYPSSLIMSVTPARVVGVSEVIVCTPPGRDKRINPLTLVAADICGVDRLFRVGGAQAIAAMAYGTGTVPRVDKIVGPGNRYVTAAKVIVSEAVAIDKPAGPSEVLVLADDASDPRLIALDMISQAEHGPGGLVGLITTSLRVVENVERLLYELVDEVPRGDVVRDVLGSGGFMYVAESLDQAVEFVNAFAPEHLEVLTEEPSNVARMVTSAGLILLGPYTPVASTDYCMGANHILPTGGYARVSSGTTALDYLKPLTIVESTKDGLESVRKHILVLSEAERLPNHGLAVDGRFRP
jgi:histidinol dehydrogenase